MAGVVKHSRRNHCGFGLAADETVKRGFQSMDVIGMHKRFEVGADEFVDSVAEHF